MRPVLTLDVHQRTQLDPLGIMEHPVHARGTKDELHQGRIPYLLDLAPQPVAPDGVCRCAGDGAREGGGGCELVAECGEHCMSSRDG
jgi:hypothetical protein